MAKNKILYAGLAVILLGGYVYFFTDWFASQQLEIGHSFRRNVARQGGFGRLEKAEANMNIVTFMINPKSVLKEVKVVPLAEFQTNQFAHPVWHLVSDSNSVPTKAMIYGMPIRGMRPEVKGATADALEASKDYRLIVQTDKFRGEHDFRCPEPVTPVQRQRQKK